MYQPSERTSVVGDDARSLARHDADGVRAVSCDHLAQFYDREDYLHDVAARFLAGGLSGGEPVVIVATPPHQRALLARLRARGHDVEALARDGRLELLDARAALAALMVGAAPDPDRFAAVVGAAIERGAARAPGNRVRAFGEMVDLLQQEGASDAVLALEALWNDLARVHPLRLLCAYGLAGFRSEHDGAQLDGVCGAHAQVFPAETYAEDEDPDARRREVVALQQRARALETEVGRRRELETALRAALRDLRRSEEVLRESERRKDEFLAMLGHELRNPLAPILTGLQLMRLRRGAADDEQGVIERQVHHLVRLVDDLLDVSRVTQGKVRLAREPIELASVVARALETVMPLYEQRSHALAVEVPSEGLVVDADPVRLAQVLANLLTNAAKYSEPGGRVAVRAWREGGDVVVSVADCGIGIPPDVLPRIFDLFVQGERALDRSQGGLGIGLTVARALVELHGGTIEAHSDGAGQGSDFVVRLPAVAPVAGASRAPAAARGGTDRASLRILLVDDNVDGAEILAEALRTFGHDVVVAHDGPDALARAAAFAPDAALLDIGLPGMDGFELARRLREALPRPPRFVAVSGYGQEQDRAKSRDAGFEQHLVKPVDLDALEALFGEMAESAA